jgi:hypothetical protein
MSIAFVAKAGCAFGAVTLTPCAPVSWTVGADDGVGVPVADALAAAEAGEEVLSDEAASRVPAAVRGNATAPAIKRAKETARAIAPALRLAGSRAQERRPVART